MTDKDKSICASCLDFSIDKVIKSREDMKPTWLSNKDYVSEFITNYNDFNLHVPKNSDVKVKLNIGKKFASKKILYWAADEKQNTSPLINEAKKAYNNFDNHGVSKVDSNGNVSFMFKCPQVYKAQVKGKKAKTYFRHLHFVMKNENHDEWDSQIYTKIVVCKYDFKKFMSYYKTGLYVIINALPSSYFAKDHIPNSFNLFYKDLKKMEENELNKWFLEVVKLHYPKLLKYITTKKLDIKEIPIITYCAHSKCNASELAIEELMKKGFVNINEYSGGMEYYRKHIPFDK